MRALDADAARRAERVDADAVAARVLARLRERAGGPAGGRVPGGGRCRRCRGGLRVTAAAAMVVRGRGLGGAQGAPPSRRARGRGARGGGGAGFPERARSWNALLRVTAEVRPVAAAVEPASGSWDDLSESQLRAVLQAVQQVQGETL